jgi:hypothetical protein
MTMGVKGKKGCAGVVNMIVVVLYGRIKCVVGELFVACVVPASMQG